MKNALVFLADGCEMCEALCVVDVLRRAGINEWYQVTRLK